MLHLNISRLLLYTLNIINDPSNTKNNRPINKMQISLNSSEIEIIFKDEREDEIFRPEKALEFFLSKPENIEKIIKPLIPEPIK